MPSGFLITLAFPCGHCNRPIVESEHSFQTREQSEFEGRVFELQCPHCKWSGRAFGAQTVEFRQVPWGFEIRPE
jgi:hypothetical protein